MSRNPSSAPLPPILTPRSTTSRQSIDNRLTAANDHLSRIADRLWPAEHAVYSGAILTAAHHANHGDDATAHRRLDELREMVSDWILPRLAGDEPTPGDWFGVGAPFSFSEDDDGTWSLFNS